MAWLRDEVVAIRSIDPTDDDFSDLRALGSILAGAQVVVLGEATHGDGETFLAKARLVHFLHREHGFDVLAFESGFYDCWKAWRAIAAGSDPQFTGELSERHLLDDLAAVADGVGMASEAWRERAAGPLANLVAARYEMGEVPLEDLGEELDRALFAVDHQSEVRRAQAVDAVPAGIGDQHLHLDHRDVETLLEAVEHIVPSSGRRCPEGLDGEDRDEKRPSR